MLKFCAMATFVTLLVGASSANAATTQFWNLTEGTITKFQLSEVGKNQWGPDQTANDKDHTVDHDERLKLTDITGGKYDVMFADKMKRVCTLRNVEIKLGDVFSIEESQLKGACKK